MNLKSVLSFIVFTFATASLAEAHAFLDHADPRVGSTLHDSPTQIKLWMTEELEGAFSKIQVFDASGTELDKKDSSASGAILTVSVPKLVAGDYRVSWTAVATDTHKTSGTFSFTIR